MVGQTLQGRTQEASSHIVWRCKRGWPRRPARIVVAEPPPEDGGPTFTGAYREPVRDGEPTAEPAS